MKDDVQILRDKAKEYGQEHVFRCWERLDNGGRERLRTDLGQVDFALMKRLADTWIFDTPPGEVFQDIQPVQLTPPANQQRPDAREAWKAGEEALKAGRVGLFLVAGGQGTRLGYDGPKGAYPMGPITQKSLFENHAEKIHNLQSRYDCILPWYIMVSTTNGAATETFFREHDFFGLKESNIKFFTQRMVPCLDDEGKFMLAGPDCLAMNPNGHGGSIPALVENGILEDARSRGIDTLSYFQVDNWAANIVDPYFIGYHVLANAEMSSKNHRKNAPREAVGVHCLCDGEYRVIEYSELDIYPQLLEEDAQGELLFYAGNPAIHILSVDFVDRIYTKFEVFPWHQAHKKVPYLDINGELFTPEAPNAYKFETFIFDALRFISHEPVALEILRPGEFTPVKQFSGLDSVESTWAMMRDHWAQWLDAAGCTVPRDAEGHAAIPIEISPQFALSQNEFVQKTVGQAWPGNGPILVGPDGEVS
jgi:UDP-N-acetylglucosamine/UDP-N-acetylgalactosamine diphosphorylase